jgi:hypothetical protein
MAIDETFTQREVRDPRKLAPKLDAISAVVADVPVLSVTSVDGEDGTASITVQANDGNGVALASKYLVSVWVSGTDGGAPNASAGQTAFAVATGVEIAEVTDLAEYRVLTDATGTAVITLTGADATYYVMAECVGKVASGASVITGN